jgi:hypothetical protein
MTEILVLGGILWFTRDASRTVLPPVVRAVLVPALASAATLALVTDPMIGSVCGVAVFVGGAIIMRAIPSLGSLGAFARTDHQDDRPPGL